LSSLSFEKGFSSNVFTKLLLAELPRLTLPPMKVSRDAHSVTIRWARWRRSRDIGTGPVDGYFVYYRAIGEESWTKLRVGSTRLNIGALLEHTGYTITIIPIHRDGYVGYTGPELNVSTCGGRSTLSSEVCYNSLVCPL